MAFAMFGKLRRSLESSPNDSAPTVDEELSDFHSSGERRDRPLCLSTTTIFGDDHAARDMMQHEKGMSVEYMLKYYHATMFWASSMAAPIFMHSYAAALLSSLFSYEPFITAFGHQESDQGDYTISNPWQIGTLIASACGQLIGLCMAPYVVRFMGYRGSRDVGLILTAFFLTMEIWSSGSINPLAVFLAAQLLLGILWGLLQALTLPYISDITPTQLRAPALAVINIFWLAGQFVLAAVLQHARHFKYTGWSIQAPILIQWSWLIPMLILAFLAPESPLRLVRKGRDDDKVKRILRRLHRYPDFSSETALSMLQAVNRHEEKTTKKTGLLACFRGVNLRRTEIAVMVSITQQCVGMPLITYPLKLLQQDGLSIQDALPITVGLFAVFILSTLCCMPTMRFVGRRTLWIAGLGIEMVILVMLGCLAFYVEHDPKNISGVIAYLTVSLGMVYHFTTGPVCYAIIADTPATRLRIETNAIACAAHVLLSIGNLFLVPQLLQDAALGWDLGSRAAPVWAATAALCLVWAWFRLPEMKNRTPAEIDILFEQNVTARQWHKMVL
ncbi:hypothetical protein E4U55_004384 [Claviceps digitariae]|nr:hypothetical protein E4U55_004384 [Claviceps digitariae]